MTCINFCLLVGRLKEEVEADYLPARDVHVLRFVLAVDNSWTDAHGKTRKGTTFVTCKAWGKQATYIADNAKAGDYVMVRARYMVDKYYSGGRTKYFPYMNVERFMIMGKSGIGADTPQSILDEFEDLSQHVKKPPE